MCLQRHANDRTVCCTDKCYLKLRRSSYHRGERHVTAVDPGQAKVGQLHLALTGHQNILWFQVSMHHPIRVKEREAAQQLPHQVLKNMILFGFELDLSKIESLSPLKTVSAGSHFNTTGG